MSKFQLEQNVFTYAQTYATEMVIPVTVKGIVANDGGYIYNFGGQGWVPEDGVFSDKREAYTALITKLQAELAALDAPVPETLAS